MPNTYVTMGQAHLHRINGQVINKDCVVVIKCEDEKSGREKAFDLFGPKFCFSYYEDQFDHSTMKYFPRGFIYV